MNLKKLKGKVINKVLKMLSNFIVINIKYKPKGIVSLDILKNDDGIKYYEITPPYISDLKLTNKFIEDCSSYNKPTLSVAYPGDFIVSIEKGRIYNIDPGNIAVMSDENLFIEELSFQWRSGEKMSPSSENMIFHMKIFSKPEIYYGKVFSLLSGGGAIDYYYHWVIDSMPKIFLLRQSGLFDKIDYFLVPNYEHKFQIEYLESLGIEKSKIINANLIRHIQADVLLVTSYIRIMAHLPHWVPEFLNRSFIVPGKNHQDKLLYIARGDAAMNRKVLNETELITMLKEMNFEIHFLSKLNVQEQAELFNASKLIVASHGGGLTNLVFCRPGTKVLEFFPDNYVNHLFCDICNKRGLEYEYIVCEAEGFTGNDLDRAAANVIADLHAIKTKIQELLS